MIISKENICTTLSLYFSKWRFRQNQKFTHPFMYKIGFVLSHFCFYPKKNTYYHSDIFMHHQKWRCIFLLFEVLQIIWEIGKMEDLFYIYFCVPILKMIHPSLLIFSLIFCILHSMHLQIKKKISNFKKIFRPLFPQLSKQTPQQKIIIGFPAMWSLPEKW